MIKRAQATCAFTYYVATYCEGLEVVSVGCLGVKCEHAEGDPNHACEAGFSWSQCDSCGSTLGGDRLEAHGLYRPHDGADLESIKMEICVDCVMYHANGETPAWR